MLITAVVCLSVTPRAEAVNTIAWGTLGTCTQAMGTAAFPAANAGSATTVSGFRGCINANAAWDLFAAVTTPLTATNDTTTIPATGTNYQILVPTPTQSLCKTICSLTGTAPGIQLVNNGPKATGGNAQPFTYSLTLHIPTGATGGAYTGGVITFTASD